MQPISYARHQFPPEIIRHAVWLYLRFTLSYRDVEELLAERGLDISYETIRRWVLKFGCSYARNLRRLRPQPADTWHLDEMVIRVQGRRLYLWRAVDSEGEILDMLVQSRRDKGAALRLMRKLLKKHGFAPKVLVTDKLRSYAAARRDLGLSVRHEQGMRRNNRAENSHQVIRRREHKMQRFKPPMSAQRFLSVHAVVHKYLQFRAPSDLPSDAAPLPSRGRAAVAKRDRRRVSTAFPRANPARRDSRDNARRCHAARCRPIAISWPTTSVVRSSAPSSPPSSIGPSASATASKAGRIATPAWPFVRGWPSWA
jgi:putative transposase